MPPDPAYSESVNRLIDQFAQLPGIGRRTAGRLAFHILKANPNDALALSTAIRDVKSNVRNCSICYHLTEADPCPICADPRRNQRQILVVEQPRDVINLEQTHAYRGAYHVLLGHLAPLEGVGPETLTIQALLNRVTQAQQQNQQLEIILGTNPNMEGDGTALYLADLLTKHKHVSTTRLARGLPSGSQLEFANKAVLSDAINSRQPMQ